MGKQFSLMLTGIAMFFMAAGQKTSLKNVKSQIIDLLGQQHAVFAVAFKDLSSGKTLYINEHALFHAASTMKTPVLITAYQQAAEGKLAITDSITIVNRFKSIADSSDFSLLPADDSEADLYQHIGEKTSLYHLLYQMIIYSSNLATNIVIQQVGAANVTAAMKAMGAHDIQVLRGVEDGKAFEKGLNNVVSAYDLCLLFEKMAKGKVVNAAASEAMIQILLDQKFNDIIPAKLPPTVKVAHKTGWITGLHHDSGIIFLPTGRKYVLVLLSKDLTDEKAGVAAMAGVSELLYNYVVANEKQR